MTNIYDIETRPKEALVKQFAKPFSKTFTPTEFDHASVKFGNIKDQDKIKAKIEEAKQNHITAMTMGAINLVAEQKEYEAALLDKAALHPSTSEICAIGIHLEGNQKVSILSGDEKEILQNFWTVYMQQDGAWASYSGSNDKSNFDVRGIIHRSWVHGLSLPYSVIDKGFITRQFIDLTQHFLAGAPYPTYVSADNCAKQLGIIGTTNDAGKVYAKDELDNKWEITGKNFHEFIDSEDKEKQDIAKIYLKNDIALERGIADIIL